ncbi:Mannose-1-phosphate guanyltransferase [Neolecta irregularis DAH-3]|uniref:Mannose-1-phosphate guanyltransferase n=1 Tax=Neolecta irregularis (strain DAH-3) TaxID=1198029 RepID=A0A1U7LPT0_NEOID|nr:Mannose-1-phosphate guanyltransferase [Neolecta irregularis DAH-3]|eukprot:OLL24552.1 Mannose-1-phosphate guanyltransferase [Neolecta irregularis DAH-3]
MEKLAEYEKTYGVKITFSLETEPLGTAGPLALAREILKKDNTPFFVLNADVICNYPFNQLLKFHQSHGKQGTIVATKVEEWNKYGVIVSRHETTQIDRFVEKPREFVGNRINADRIELRAMSIEQEVFPSMASEGQLHMFDLEGYWMDVGQPKDYLTGTCLYLSSMTKRNPEALALPSAHSFIHAGNVLIDPTATIGENCKIGPNVVIGPNCVIGDGVRLQRCVLFSGSKVKDHAWIKSAIIGWNSTVGKWGRLEGVTILGDDVYVRDEIYVNGGSVLPHKVISANVEVPQIIM